MIRVQCQQDKGERRKEKRERRKEKGRNGERRKGGMEKGRKGDKYRRDVLLNTLQAHRVESDA
jgi:hypothetical protein